MPRAVFFSGRKLGILGALAVALIGVAWWNAQPPPEPVPVADGRRLSEILEEVDYQIDLPPVEELRSFGPEGVAWLTYKLEHGQAPFVKREPLPLDNAPGWLRARFPEKWGGLKPSPEYDERARAAALLGGLGYDATSAIPALTRSVAHKGGKNYDLVNESVYALQAMGQASRPVVEKILDHGSLQAQFAALRSMRPRFSPWRKDGNDDDAAFAISALVKALRSPVPWLRKEAADVMCECRKERQNDSRCDAAILPLIELLSDPRADVMSAAMDALAVFGPPAAPAIPGLAHIARSDPLRMEKVAVALHGIGQASWPVIEDLLDHGSTEDREALLTATIEQWHRHGNPVSDVAVASITHTLSKAGHDPDPAMRTRAIAAYAFCRDERLNQPLFEAVIPELIRFLSDTDEAVRAHALDVLVDFETKDGRVVTPVMALLDDGDPWVRCTAIEALVRLDMLEQRSVEPLRVLCDDPDRRCREAAGRTLRAFGLSPDEPPSATTP